MASRGHEPTYFAMIIDVSELFFVSRSPKVFPGRRTFQVGRAVALKLALEGFDVVCCTGSDDRFEALQMELVQLDRLKCTRGPQARGNLDAMANGAFSRVSSPFAQIHNESVDIGARVEQGHETTGRLLRARRVDEGVRHRVWIIGKSDPSVR